MIEADLQGAGVTDMTAAYGPRLVEQARCAYLRPMIVHSESPDSEVVHREYMFPFTTVVHCPQDQMLAKIGPTLVCTAITRDQSFIRQLSDAVHIDRLNIGPIPTTRLELAAAARRQFDRLPVPVARLPGLLTSSSDMLS